MRALADHVRGLKIWLDGRGQDLVDYALFGAFVVLAAGAIWPVVAESIREIFTKLAAAVSGQASGTVK